MKLRNLGFLNDETFSNALLETQKRNSSRGPRAIQQELQRKGIDKELQEKVIDSYSEDEQISVARKLAEKEAARNRSQTPDKLNNEFKILCSAEDIHTI